METLARTRVCALFCISILVRLEVASFRCGVPAGSRARSHRGSGSWCVDGRPHFSPFAYRGDLKCSPTYALRWFTHLPKAKKQASPWLGNLSMGSVVTLRNLSTILSR